MTTDRELLEGAARAAGMDDAFYANDSRAYEGEVMYSPSLESYWNPLTDDGDALRLAVELGIQLYFFLPNDDIGKPYTEASRFVKEQHNNDPYAATRRAIVRAAYEIWKGEK